MLPITGTSAGSAEINDPEEVPLNQNPIQSALLQLQELNDYYRNRRENLYIPVYSRQTIALVSHVVGVVPAIVVSILVPIKLNETLECGIPSHSDDCWYDSTENCVWDYNWCSPMNFIGNVLWNYVLSNYNSGQNWAKDILNVPYNIMYFTINKNEFIDGLTVVCNTTSGVEGVSRLNVDFHPTEMALIGTGITLLSHTLSQVFTYAITSLGLETTCLSFREYYRLHRNIIELKSYREIQLSSLISQETDDLPHVMIDPTILEESDRIFWEQTRRYCFNLSSVILFATEMILLFGIWVAANKKWGTVTDNFKDDPFKYVTKPSHCQPGTYEIDGTNYMGNLVPIPGGIQVLMNSTYPYASASSEIINIFAVGIFTAFIVPGIHTINDLMFRVFGQLGVRFR